MKLETPIARARPSAEQLLEGAPGADELAARRQRPVDEQQVDVVELHPVERGLRARDRPVVALELAVELRRHEPVLARDAAAAHTLAGARPRCRTWWPCRRGGSRVPTATTTASASSASFMGQVPRPELRDARPGVESDVRDRGGHASSLDAARSATLPPWHARSGALENQPGHPPVGVAEAVRGDRDGLLAQERQQLDAARRW